MDVQAESGVRLFVELQLLQNCQMINFSFVLALVELYRMLFLYHLYNFQPASRKDTLEIYYECDRPHDCLP